MRKRHKIGMAVSMKAAVARTGIRLDAMKIAKKRGCRAFRRNGTVQCDELLRYLRQNPEIIEYVDSFPDIHKSRALREDVRRQREQFDLERKLANLVWTEDVSHVRRGVHSTLLAKLMPIPERVAKKYSQCQDPQWIWEDLNMEIRTALTELADEARTEWENHRRVGN